MLSEQLGQERYYKATKEAREKTLSFLLSYDFTNFDRQVFNTGLASVSSYKYQDVKVVDPGNYPHYFETFGEVTVGGDYSYSTEKGWSLFSSFVDAINKQVLTEENLTSYKRLKESLTPRFCGQKI